MVSLWFGMSQSTLADSYVAVAAKESGLVAEQAAEGKSVTFSIEPLLPADSCWDPGSSEHFSHGRRISSVSGEDRESALLYQRISVNIQRFNSVLLHNSFADDDPVM